MDLTQKSFPVNFSPGTFVFAKYWRWHLGRLIQSRDHYSLKWYFTFKDGASKIDPIKRPQEKDKKQKYMQQEIIITELWCLAGFFLRMFVPHFITIPSKIFERYWKVFVGYLKVLEMGILVVCDFALVFALAPISPLFCHFFAFALALYFTLS